ncbi:MAG: segregation/condensation protein A [Thermodesulfobacteriota bacterium]|nr:segregation/condensation protein A [Thermodesulfobacteriota bacterium]
MIETVSEKRRAMRQDDTYKVKTDIFEGPMDLLVHLIKKNEVSIYDIPIADITRQFLEYIEWLKLMNIDVAGDFLYMAAILTNIKSRTLLPSHNGPDDDEDPRMEITRALEEYMQIKNAAETLSSRDILNEDTFVRPTDRKALAAEADDGMIVVGLFELIDAFQNILDRLPASTTLSLSTEVISIKERISQIVDILEKNRSVTFDQLFEENYTKSDIVVTFLALLEMVKLSIVAVRQHTHNGVIRLFYQ